MRTKSPVLESLLLAVILFVVAGCGTTAGHEEEETESPVGLAEVCPADDEDLASTVATVQTTPKPVDRDRFLGQWVVRRTDDSGNQIWGDADVSRYALDEFDLDFLIDLEDGHTPWLHFDVRPDGRLVGTWRSNPWDSVDGLEYSWSWSGELEFDEKSIVGELASEPGSFSTTFYRTTAISGEMEGAWKSAADDSLVIAADDGRGNVLFRRVESDGGLMPIEGKFLVFDKGTRLYIHSRESEVLVLDRAPRSPLDGRWLVAVKNGTHEMPDRGVRIVVAHEQRLYCLDSMDGRELEQSARLEIKGDKYVDLATGWSGRLSEDQSYLELRENGDPRVRLRMTRARQPAQGELGGKWHSVSSDLRRPGDEPLYGQATIVEDAGGLRLSDVSQFDEQYELQADWVVDHFEGLWWFAESPSRRYQWRGDLTPDGKYLHGSYRHGEWSFSRYPITHDELLTVSSASEFPSFDTDPLVDPAQCGGELHPLLQERATRIESEEGSKWYDRVRDFVDAYRNSAGEPDPGLALTEIIWAAYLYDMLGPFCWGALSALQHSDDDPLALNTAAVCLLELGDLETARRLLECARVAEPEFSLTHDNMAFLHNARGNVEDALAAKRRAAVSRPGNAHSAWDGYALAHKHGRDQDAAFFDTHLPSNYPLSKPDGGRGAGPPVTQVCCNCSGRFYDDVGQCVAECEVSLACFTGICEPTRCCSDTSPFDFELGICYPPVGLQVCFTVDGRGSFSIKAGASLGSLFNAHVGFSAGFRNNHSVLISGSFLDVSATGTLFTTDPNAKLAGFKIQQNGDWRAARTPVTPGIGISFSMSISPSEWIQRIACELS